MKRGLAIVGATVGLVLVARRFILKSGALSWERMLERMPDTAPPKWMFANIKAIRENTDRILERLDARAVAGGSPAVA